MKKHLFVLVACLCVFGLPSCKQSGNKEITSLLTQHTADLASAVENNDPSKIETYFAPDFMYHEGTGKRMYKDEFIKGFEKNINTLKSFDIIDVEVIVYGSKLANVTGGVISVWVDSKGKEHVYKSRLTMVWKPSSGKWQCIIAHANLIQDQNRYTD